MSEQRDDSGGCLLFVVIVLWVVVIGFVVFSELRERDNAIRDLQRRVGQLESSQK